MRCALPMYPAFRLRCASASASRLVKWAVRCEPGTAARIFTGAPIPAGADAVIMQEKCEAVGDKVTLKEKPPRGEAIRKAGIDIARGDVVLKPGVRLKPQHCALAASIGAANLTVSIDAFALQPSLPATSW